MFLRVSNKAFHLETDMFSCLSPTALNKTAKDVFCDAVHGIYQNVACFQNAIGYHSIRPNVAWFTPIIKVGLPLHLGSHTYWRAKWADHLQGISTKSDKEYGKNTLKFIYIYVKHHFHFAVFMEFKITQPNLCPEYFSNRARSKNGQCIMVPLSKVQLTLNWLYETKQ